MDCSRSSAEIFVILYREPLEDGCLKHKLIYCNILYNALFKHVFSPFAFILELCLYDNTINIKKS